MMVMPSTHSSATIHYLAGKYPGKIGWLFGPAASHKTKSRPWMPFALDNDAFSAWENKTEWDVESWRQLLSRMKRDEQGVGDAMMYGKTPRWALVPDVVADKTATLEKWEVFYPEVKKFGWPTAFAVQDGMQPDDVPRSADVVFVGGTTDWKWKTVTVWAKNFKRVHVGRVNSIERVVQCEKLGVESVDGTGWFRDGETGRRMVDLMKWLGEIPTAQQFQIEF